MPIRHHEDKVRGVGEERKDRMSPSIDLGLDSVDLEPNCSPYARALSA
jgi:hypothetical protein